MVYVLVSGGIDSMVAAVLLKESASEVVGLHLLTGYSEMTPEAIDLFSRRLNLPVETVDCRAAFEDLVIKYFVDAYRRGETPNPCLRCNPAVKFGLGLDYALQRGADGIASGHYCRVMDGAGGRVLQKGADQKKDQSYFLGFLSTAQLSRAHFPVGGLTKPQVRDLARRRGLSPMIEKESQDICFIPPRSSYGELVQRWSADSFQPGPIEDLDGNIIGSHAGVHLFTVGQRRGINCPAKKPYYVAGIDVAENRIRVGFREQLYVSECRVRRVNWLKIPDGTPALFTVKVRYRHAAVAALVTPQPDDNALVQFQKPQFGITPGQGAVFYDHDIVAGAGIISR